MRTGRTVDGNVFGWMDGCGVSWRHGLCHWWLSVSLRVTGWDEALPVSVNRGNGQSLDASRATRRETDNREELTMMYAVPPVKPAHLCALAACLGKHYV